jgi:hypothetical protein
MATTTLPKSNSRKGTRIGAIGDLKDHESMPRTSNDDGDDSRCEEMAPDGQQVETSPKSRNPGKVKVDPAFEDLSSTAQAFLRAQGITSALNLMATNAKELVPAWIEWNKGAFLKISKATSDVRLWKREVRDRWYSSSTKERVEMVPDGQKVEASPESRNPGKMKVDPAFEDLSSTAQEFLQAQGITSALHFVLASTNGLTQAWIEWNKGAFKTDKARSDVRLWKRKVRGRWCSSSTKERAGDAVDNSPPTVEVVPALQVYESEARDFLIAQGIASTEAFLLTKTDTLANALMQWRDQSQKAALGFGSALNLIYRWKRNSRELSGQLLIEQDAEFQTLSTMARRFLSSQNIATAEAFLSMNVNATANALMDWRKQRDSSECTIVQARWCISNWRLRMRERQLDRQEASRVLDPVSEVLSSIVSDWQKALQERITGTERMHGALSHSTTPSAVSASPNESRSSLLPRLGASKIEINQTLDKPDETTFGAATSIPVSQALVQPEQAAAVNETRMAKTTKDENTSNDCSGYLPGDSKAAEPRDDSNEQNPGSKRKRPEEESSPKKYRYRVFWV